jgi:hypothetical protein
MKDKKRSVNNYNNDVCQHACSKHIVDVPFVARCSIRRQHTCLSVDSVYILCGPNGRTYKTRLLEWSSYIKCFHCRFAYLIGHVFILYCHTTLQRERERENDVGVH